MAANMDIDWAGKPGLIEPGQIWEHWSGGERVKIAMISEDGKTVLGDMVYHWDRDGAHHRGLFVSTLLHGYFLVGRVQP